MEICVCLAQVAKRKKASCPSLGKKEAVARESAVVFGRDVGKGRQLDLVQVEQDYLAARESLGSKQLGDRQASLLRFLLYCQIELLLESLSYRLLASSEVYRARSTEVSMTRVGQIHQA